MTEPLKGRALETYSSLEADRSPYLQRARLCSKYTIPWLIKPDGSNGSDDLYKPFQSIGARGLNNVASKYTLTLLPPTRRFFRLMISDKLKKEIESTGQADQASAEKDNLELALSKVEESVVREMERLGVRTVAYEAMRHLAVAGNVIMHVHKNGMRLFMLPQYVVRRDRDGNLLEFVIKESIAVDALPASVRETVRAMIASETATLKDNDPRASKKEVDIYTHVFRTEGGKWEAYQEVKGLKIAETETKYGEQELPWLVLRWSRVDGENYGRSHVDDYIGDIITAESLSRSIIRGAAIAAKVLWLVNPNGMTDPDDLERAEEGEFVPGIKSDIEALGLEKFNDFQVANSVLGEVISRLSYAFLLNSAVRRQGERVTAEEIRFMAGELEDAHGGTYSVLSKEFQLALVRIIMSIMAAAGKLPKLPESAVEPTIVTGIDALGRSHELSRLDAFVQGAQASFGAEVMQFLNMPTYLRRRAAALDIDDKGLIKTDEQVAQAQAVAQQAEMMNKLGPHVIKAANDQYMNQQAAQQPSEGASVNG